MFLGYIKDCNNISNRPKSVVRVSTNGTSTIKIDLLSSAKSSFSVLSIPSNINNGDIFSIYDRKGKEWYTGKITSYGDGKITCTQSQSILSGIWKCENFPSQTLEEELKQIVDKLISGRVGDYTDEFIKNKYKSINVVTSSMTSGQLPTFEDEKTIDFEKFIYQMYSEYGIMFKIHIPYEGDCLIEIIKPDYNSLLISDNAQAISSISPTLEIEQYNKLVIFFKSKKDGKTGEVTPPSYRATYVVSADSTPRIIRLDQESVLNRFVETNTKIVFSDDDLDTIVNANLSVDMYNHKLTFDMLLDNKLYDWEDIKLGQPLEVWNGTDYYKTLLTGYEIQLPVDSEPVSVKFVCGKVRTALTDKLKMGGN